jgi:hypothetical protein
MGIGLYATDGSDPHGPLETADVAMYLAKKRRTQVRRH